MKTLSTDMWHARRFLTATGNDHLNNNTFVATTVRAYVKTVVDSWLRTYVFNSGLLITLIFLAVSFERIHTLIAQHFTVSAVALLLLALSQWKFVVLCVYALKSDSTLRIWMNKIDVDL